LRENTVVLVLKQSTWSLRLATDAERKSDPFSAKHRKADPLWRLGRRDEFGGADADWPVLASALSPKVQTPSLQVFFRVSAYMTFRRRAPATRRRTTWIAPLRKKT